MKILHVFYDITQQSGYQIRSKYLLSIQRELGLDITAVFLPLRMETCCKTYVSNIPFLAPEIPRHWQSFLRLNSSLQPVGIVQRALMRRCFAAYLKKFVQTLKPDIVHAHSAWMSAAQAFVAAKAADLPVLYEIRGLWEETAVSEGRAGTLGSRYWYFKLQENRLMHRAGAIVALSEGLKQEIIRRHVLPEKITVIPNGIDPEEFKPIPRDQQLAQELGCASKTVVGYISSLRKMEGIEYLLKALAKINENLVALIVGDGPERARLTRLANDLGVAAKVHFIGQVPHEKIKQYYSLIDIFVVPRKKEKVCEMVTPLKPLEAMAMGKCVLMSDVGGLRELAGDGKTAVFFEPENPDALAEKLQMLVSSEEARQSIGANARKYVLAERSWRSLVKEYVPLYQKLVGEN